MVCVDFHARAHSHYSADDDLVSGLQPLFHYAQSINDRPQLHRLILHGAVRREAQHKLLVLVRAYSVVPDQDGFILSAAHQPNAREQARGEEPVAIVENRADSESSRSRIHLVVHEIDIALVRITLFVRETEIDRIAEVARAR